MTSDEKRIYEVIASGKGLKGSEIASLLNMDKKAVNSILYHSDALRALVEIDKNYRWTIKKKQDQGNKKQITANTPEPDTDLRNLCNYFLNCLALESSGAVSQFLTSHYSLKYAYIHDLEIDPYKDDEAIQLLKTISIEHNKKVYLGYPVRVFTILGKNNTKYRKIAPVFMFDVSYEGGKIDLSSVPSINMDVIKAYTGKNTDDLVVELINLENELGLDEPDADVDKAELVLRLTEIRQWDYKENIDPYDISASPLPESVGDGIYNRAIVIETDREQYTHGLESELITLANMPTESYKGTALYSWIKKQKNTMQEGTNKPLLEVLPLNSEQALAVSTALRSDLTIITGPPGTGKSQVVTDLLINIVWNGKRALFSSKNNKAVDVVDMRVNSLCKRPVLLRMGGNQHAYRLAEIIEGLLNSTPKGDDKAEAEIYQKEYMRKSREAADIQEEKRKTIEARNNLDEIEQKYCLVRDKVCNQVKTENFPEQGQIISAAQNYMTAHEAACKDKQSLFVRLFWGAFAKKREIAERQATHVYDRYAEKYKLKTITQLQHQGGISSLLAEATEYEDAIRIGREYKQAYDRLKKNEPIEQLDQQLAKNKEEMAYIAENLWNKWLLSKGASFTVSERAEMSSFISSMKLAGDVDLSEYPELKKQFSSLSKQMTKHLQSWAVTSLSAKSKIPFEAGLFDYLIIDEASQCDIASILPLLYRAKHAVIIGDPMQLSHISQLSKKQDLNLIQKYNVDPCWAYSVNSLYALAAGKVASEQIIQLKDHFRSCADIIEFSNENFYDGSLRTATKYSYLKTPVGEKPGIRWIDTIGQTVHPDSGSAYNLKEAETVVKELARLVSVGYQGTIGVTTPFRRQAEEIRSMLEKKENKQLYEELLLKHEFIADTVHKFQGDERDVMIFSPVVSNGAPDGTLGFLARTGNLFNVAITRARAVLTVIGNYQYCRQSNIPYLKAFAEYVKKIATKVDDKTTKAATDYGRIYPWVANPEKVSEWEKVFYTALYDAGVQTIPQYPVEKYNLDLAVILDNDIKLDIEVDGEMYHKQWNGELCYRDQLRNQRMFELGWDVRRFWVYQIRDDMDWCIQEIKKWISDNNHISEKSTFK